MKRVARNSFITMSTISHQLTLDVALRDGFRFESFYADAESGNKDTIDILKAFLRSNEQQQNYLWGKSKSGKTHLLQACCAIVAEGAQPISYIPLKVLSSAGPDMINGLSHSRLIAVDDIDHVMGDIIWETALFNLINQTRENRQHLLLSSRENPRLLKCELPDLQSRLVWGGSYQIHALTDDEKIKALQARAKQRGFELNDKVISYLFKRYPRDITSLTDILNKLDKESLRQKTVITIPFVKQVLDKS